MVALWEVLPDINYFKVIQNFSTQALLVYGNMDLSDFFQLVLDGLCGDSPSPQNQVLLNLPKPVPEIKPQGHNAQVMN